MEKINKIIARIVFVLDYPRYVLARIMWWIDGVSDRFNLNYNNGHFRFCWHCWYRVDYKGDPQVPGEKFFIMCRFCKEHVWYEDIVKSKYLSKKWIK